MEYCRVCGTSLTNYEVDSGRCSSCETALERLKQFAHKEDVVNHPKHYTKHPSGIECIEITQHMDFLLGNAMKYIWRAGLKGEVLEDLNKAKWYIERKIKLLEDVK